MIIVKFQNRLQLEVTLGSEQGLLYLAPLALGGSAWRECLAGVLGGSEIGFGSVVAVGSVIKGKFPENALIAGIPGQLKQIIERI